MSDDTASRPGLIRSIAHRLAGEQQALPVEGQLASFDGATGWLNSEPLTPEGLRGRVVLVDFWTYTCVNWLRTPPYVRAWAAKYADAGLTVVGVHTPEFGFEHDVDNVIAHARTLGVEYPIAIDSDYGVWRAFDNHFWPAVYIADVRGADPFPPLRGRRVRDDRDGHPAVAARRRRAGHRPGSGGGRASGPRGGRRLAHAAAPETYTGYRPGLGLRPGRRRSRSTSRTPTPRPPRCRSTTGRSRGRGTSPGTRLCRPSRADGSRSSSMPAISTSSWVQQPGEPRSRSGSSSMASPRWMRLGAMSPPTAAGIVDDQRTYQLIRQPGRSSSADSRSSSSRPASRPTASRSAERTSRGRPS